MSVKKRRSVVKTITWRVIAVLLTFFGIPVCAVIMNAVLGLNVTVSLGESAIFTVFIHSVKTLAYYLHEVLWNKVSFGRKVGDNNERHK